jgi:hypothetical protein
VDAVTEADRDGRRAVDVEVVGALERPGIPGGSAGQQQHGEAGPNRAALELPVLDREASLVLRRGQQAEDLLDGLRDALRVGGDPTPLVGVLVEQHDGVADQLGDRLRARPAEEPREAGDLVVVETGLDAVAAVDGHLGEAGEHVVGRLPALLLYEVEEVSDRLEYGSLSLDGGVDLAGLAVQAQVEPLADLLALTFGHAQHPGDDLDRERRRQVGHGVERVALGQRFEEAPDHFSDHRLEGHDRSRREHPADQGAEPVVLGRVHHDDHPEVPDELGVLRQGRQVDAVGAREPPPVAVGGDHVREA